MEVDAERRCLTFFAAPHAVLTLTALPLPLTPAELRRMAILVFKQLAPVPRHKVPEDSMEAKDRRVASLAHFIARHPEIGAQPPWAGTFFVVDTQSDEQYRASKRVADMMKSDSRRGAEGGGGAIASRSSAERGSRLTELSCARGKHEDIRSRIHLYFSSTLLMSALWLQAHSGSDSARRRQSPTPPTVQPQGQTGRHRAAASCASAFFALLMGSALICHVCAPCCSFSVSLRLVERHGPDVALRVPAPRAAVAAENGTARSAAGRRGGQRRQGRVGRLRPRQRAQAGRDEWRQTVKGTELELEARDAPAFLPPAAGLPALRPARDANPSLSCTYFYFLCTPVRTPDLSI